MLKSFWGKVFDYLGRLRALHPRGPVSQLGHSREKSCKSQSFQVLRCASELFLEKIGDHRFASDMHIIADLGAIVCCIASIAFNIFALPSHAFRRCVSRRLLRNHGTDMVKLGIAGVAVLCALFAIAFLGMTFFAKRTLFYIRF